jgi:isopenicillin-N epimerase
VNVAGIGAAFYAGNCHKWMCAPKGSAFLHVRRDRQDRIRPLAISHGASSPRTDRSHFRLEHDWSGTADPSPFLSIPPAIEFGGSLFDGGWPALMARNREVTIHGRRLLCGAVDADLPAPDEMIGSMASIPLPIETSPVPVEDGRADDPLHAALLARGIQVVVAPWPQRPTRPPWRRLVRFSVAPYVDDEDIAQLARELRAALPAVAR